MEALSDGVFGFAMTLLVASIAVRPPGTPLEQFFRAWPAYLTYVISFLTVGAAWIAHVGLTDTLAHTDSIFLRLNLLALLVVVFLPFPTRLIADAPHTASGERVAVAVYGLTLLTIHLMGFALNTYVRAEHVDTEHVDIGDADDDAAGAGQRRRLIVVAGYVGSILIGLAFPAVAVVLYFGIAVFLMVPFRQVGRVLFHGNSRPPIHG
jgi:uncharacterized membrane protein